jgi:hypothetical protein
MASMNSLVKVGTRPNVVQIVPARGDVRLARNVSEEDEHELITEPLASPTGPGGAEGFHNVAGSQIAVPHTTNVYLGNFWGNRNFVEEFSKAVVENGYLDPLHELGYGTGSGKYLGSIDGPALQPNTQFRDSDAHAVLSKLIDAGTLHVDKNSLFMLILPDKVTSILDGERSCDKFCGYHDSFKHKGHDVAYAVLPSSLCSGCGGKIGDFTAVYAHELAEAVTDTIPGKGWVAADGSENGDLEAWILFGWGPPGHSKRFTVQGYYTNERGNTVGKWRASTAAAPSPVGAPGAHGKTTKA